MFPTSMFPASMFTPSMFPPGLVLVVRKLRRVCRVLAERRTVTVKAEKC